MSHGSALQRSSFDQFRPARQLREQDVAVLQLLRSRDAAREPVVHTLDGVAKTLRHLGGAAELCDEGCVVHTMISHHVNGNVNAACINILCSERTMRAMHASMTRLLNAARAATGNSALTWAEIGVQMQVSSAVLSNWKSANRGLSKEGAIVAERLYGVSADFLLTGRSRTGKNTVLVHSRAQPMSQQVHKVPLLLEWGDLKDMAEEDLPDEFQVELPDDAMAPDAKAGWLVQFDRRKEPRFGNGILVRHTSGEMYFRRYRQAPGGWKAHADNDDYMSLESDGLEILAVARFVMRPWE